MTTEINYVKLQSYTEQRKIILCDSVLEFTNIIKSYSNHPEYSLLEILTNDTIRFFMDIENIPDDQDKLIYTIIEDLVKYFNIPLKYSLTLNKKSNHKGLSYHVYFPFRINKTIAYKLIQNFLCEHSSYYSYIDSSIYTKNRLFRTIGSVDPGKVINTRNLESVHELVEGDIEDTIIQNYINLENFPVSETFDLNKYISSNEYIKFKYSKINRERFSNNYNYNIQNYIKENKEQFQKLIQIIKTNQIEKSNNALTNANIIKLSLFFVIIYFIFTFIHQLFNKYIII